MIKTFIFGLVVGLAGAAALAYFIPAIDLHRERSLISVRANGGQSEAFHINLPNDRIMAGARAGNQSSGFPEGLQWPEDELLQGAQTEVFKLRNSEDTVVGLAARVSSASEKSGAFIQWMLHLPARGTLFATMPSGLAADGYRNGQVVSGTREFAELSGALREFFNREVDDSEDSGISGRLELATALSAPVGDAE